MTPDLLYVVKPRARDDLRYSLRSVAENLPHRRVWIASPVKPPWLSDEVGHIKTSENASQKWLNLLAAIRTACSRDDVGPNLVYLDDDMFVMRPQSAMPALHRGRLADGGAGRGSYATSFRTTERVLAALGNEHDLLNYELHVPFPFHRRAMADVLAEASSLALNVRYRSLYGNHWRVGGEQIDDVKVYSGRGDLDGPFLSTNDYSFAAAPVGKVIRSTFSNAGPYERN